MKKILSGILFLFIAVPGSGLFLFGAIVAAVIDTTPAPTPPPAEFVMDEAHVVVTNEHVLVATN